MLDDEPQFCRALARLLKTHQFAVETFSDGGAFLAARAGREPDCLLLDLHMPGLNGFELLERLAPHNQKVLVITGHDQQGNEQRARALGAAAYFLKPVNETLLLSAIRAVLNGPLRAIP